MCAFGDFLDKYIEKNLFSTDVLSGNIVSMDIDSKNRMLKIDVAFSQPVKRLTLFEIEKKLQNSKLNLCKVSINPSFPSETFFAEYYNDLIQQISKETKTLLSKEEKEKMEFGTKMHEVFEYLDFKNPNIHSLPISDYFKAKIEKFLSLIDTKDIINVYKEYEFSYEKDDNYFHGIIDLILEYEDKIKIIDYKLKNIDDENYDKQIKTYKEYLSTKTNKKIETYLFSILKEKLEEK